VGHGLSRRQSRTAISGRTLCRRLDGGRHFFFLAKRVDRPSSSRTRVQALEQEDGAQNFIAILIYIAAVAVAFIYTPLALVMIALPATMYFLPERGLEKFEH
jgi:hypothetical protein